MTGIDDKKLARGLSPLNVWALAFGCIIGWGAFMMPGTTFLPKAGTLGTALAMVIGALIMVIISFSYSYMIPKYPKAGGEFTFTRACFGNGHAFWCGWFLALAYVANVPMNCTALGLMTRKLFFGVFQFGKLYQVAGYDIWAGEIILSLVVLGILTYFSLHGVKKAGWIQSVMAVSLASAFAIILISAIFSPITSWSNLTPLWGPTREASNQEILQGILAIVAVAPWAYVGFDTIPQAAEEFNFPVRKVNFIMLIAIAFGCVVYSCNNMVTAAASPDWTEFIQQHDWAVGAAVKALMGKSGLVVLGVAISCAILTGILGFLTATSRLLFSMGRDGFIPSWFAEVHPKYHTPHKAILFCLFISAFGPFFGRTALGWFVDMSAIGGAIGFGYTCASCLATIRQRNELQNHRRMATWALLGTAFSLGFCVLLLIPGLPGCLGMPSYVMLVVWTVLGAIFYFVYGNIGGKIMKDAKTSEIAILMAAGLGSRMRPLTDVTAKPLVKVRGTPLIETVLTALRRRGVKDIYIVTGYKAEQFEPLAAKCPDIHLVHNVEYDTKNNINSIAVVADLMREHDCFVCEADLYVSNPDILKRDFETSGYLGRMVRGFSSDWVFETANGRITRVGKCGTDCYNMVGVSYFKQPDAAMIADAVSSYVLDPAWAQKFWDDIVDVLVKKDLRLVVHPIEEMEIVECDTVEDLKNLEEALK